VTTPIMGQGNAVTRSDNEAHCYYWGKSESR